MVKKPLLFEQQGNSRDGISRLNGTALGEWNPSVVIPAESTLWPFVGFHPSLTWHGGVRVTIVTLVTSCDASRAPQSKRQRAKDLGHLIVQKLQKQTSFTRCTERESRSFGGSGAEGVATDSKPGVVALESACSRFRVALESACSPSAK